MSSLFIDLNLEISKSTSGMFPMYVDFVNTNTNMRQLFMNCGDLVADLSVGDVSNVKNTRYMFYRCYGLNTDLSNWKLKTGCFTNDMFTEADKQRIPSWYRF